ncbi:MAG: tRNA pseudouridine synthase [Clostridiales bacterium]|nr:tRNA pseudouridine synthase [Clostridiales bacterium]
MINGIINVYKEAGFTSHDVVAKLRRILQQKKIGHTGTLDPDAVGVLPVCLGKGTKVSDILTDTDKEYEAEIKLGITTDTQDISGKVLTISAVNVSTEQIVESINSFVGEIDQIPPMYSALKVNGKKLYELARAGIEIERKSRRITISELQILNIKDDIITIRVACSKGTYIRTLCYDIGEKLGCGATMLSLKRTKVSTFYIQDSITLAEIEEKVKADEINQYIVKIDDIFPDYDKISICEAGEKFLFNGNKLMYEHLLEEYRNRIFDKVRIYDTEDNFVAIYQFDKDKEEFTPIKMFKE